MGSGDVQAWQICPKCGARRVDKQLGLEPVHDCLGWATGKPCGECYVCQMVSVFREIWRVLRKDGTAWLNLGDSYAGGRRGRVDAGHAGTIQRTNQGSTNLWPGPVPPGLKPKDLCMIPARVALALQADGWWLRSAIIWAKGISFCETYSGSVMPESVTSRPTKAHEHVFLLAKNERYFYDHEAVKEAAIYAGKTVRNMSEDAKNAQMGKFGQTRTGFLGEVEVASTRNLRDVWAISPTPYKGAHFATFSPALVDPMIKAGTSEKGCCPACGAPYERVVEQGLTEHDGKTESAYPAGSTAHRVALLRQAARERGEEYVNRARTVCWRPTCECNAGAPVPCTVLDPFAGAGTTVLVASRLGRNGIGMELKREYAEMGRRRVFDDAPLLALPEESRGGTRNERRGRSPQC